MRYVIWLICAVVLVACESTGELQEIDGGVSEYTQQSEDGLFELEVSTESTGEVTTIVRYLGDEDEVEVRSASPLTSVALHGPNYAFDDMEVSSTIDTDGLENTIDFELDPGSYDLFFLSEFNYDDQKYQIEIQDVPMVVEEAESSSEEVEDGVYTQQSEDGLFELEVITDSTGLLTRTLHYLGEEEEVEIEHPTPLIDFYIEEPVDYTDTPGDGITKMNSNGIVEATRVERNPGTYQVFFHTTFKHEGRIYQMEINDVPLTIEVDRDGEEKQLTTDEANNSLSQKSEDELFELEVMVDPSGEVTRTLRYLGEEDRVKVDYGYPLTSFSFHSARHIFQLPANEALVDASGFAETSTFKREPGTYDMFFLASFYYGDKEYKIEITDVPVTIE